MALRRAAAEVSAKAGVLQVRPAANDTWHRPAGVNRKFPAPRRVIEIEGGYILARSGQIARIRSRLIALYRRWRGVNSCRLFARRGQMKRSEAADDIAYCQHEEADNENDERVRLSGRYDPVVAGQPKDDKDDRY